jgi:hypothetical protein
MRSCLLNSKWVLLDQNDSILLEIDYHWLTKTLILMWQKSLESDYQQMYLFFESSFNAKFNKQEILENIKCFSRIASTHNISIDQLFLDLNLEVRLQEHAFYRPALI